MEEPFRELPRLDQVDPDRGLSARISFDGCVRRLATDHTCGEPSQDLDGFGSAHVASPLVGNKKTRRGGGAGRAASGHYF